MRRKPIDRDLLRGFQFDKQAPFSPGADKRREELSLHVEQFLEQGGEIQEVESTQMAAPTYAFNVTPVAF